MIRLLTIIFMLFSLAANAMEPATRLTPQLLNESVKAALLDEGVADDISVIVFGSYPPVIYENEKPFVTSFRFTELDAGRGRFRAEAFLHEDVSRNQLGNMFVVEGRFDTMVKAPVLKRRMTDSEVISENDIEFISITSKRITREVVADSAGLIGKSPRRVISSGRLIQLGDLADPTLVRKGEMVMVVYRDGALNLRLKALAMQDGRAGDSIQLKNKESGRAFMAIVTGKGLLEVTPGGVSQQHAMKVIPDENYKFSSGITQTRKGL